MTSGAELDPGRIAAAVQALPTVAGLHSGRFGEITTLLPGRGIPGVRIRPGEVTVGVVGCYPATVAQTAADVRAAVGATGYPVHVHIGDIAAPVPATAEEPVTATAVPARS